MKLLDVEQAPEEAEPYRTLILLGLKGAEKNKETGKELGADAPIALLEFWTGEELAKDKPDEARLVAWQQWFTKTYPDQPEPVLPSVPENAKYTFEQLLTYLTSDDAQQASAARGSAVFTKAQCAKCHRHGNEGESMGPDLTTVNRRFTKKELLESLVYPSHVISSQYQAKTVQTSDGRTLTGIVAPGSAGELVILQSNGQKVVVAEKHVTGTKPSKVSAMPTGLLEPLSLEEVADLMAFLDGVETTQISRRPKVIEPR
jgi:putative heme-binding domain-containing protein